MERNSLSLSGLCVFSNLDTDQDAMQLLLMEARGQETRVQAPVLLRCVVAADMQVSFFLLR